MKKKEKGIRNEDRPASQPSAREAEVRLLIESYSRPSYCLRKSSRFRRRQMELNHSSPLLRRKAEHSATVFRLDSRFAHDDGLQCRSSRNTASGTEQLPGTQPRCRRYCCTGQTDFKIEKFSASATEPRLLWKSVSDGYDVTHGLGSYARVRWRGGPMDATRADIKICIPLMQRCYWTML